MLANPAFIPARLLVALFQDPVGGVPMICPAPPELPEFPELPPPLSAAPAPCWSPQVIPLGHRV